jgi:hypothetical protein
MPVPPALVDAYDPERFRSAGHRLIGDLAELLEHLRALCRP